MNRFVNFIGIVVLCGILLKLSYVFIYLFGELDAGSWMSRVTGVTFAFASIYFVVKIRRNWLKVVMVALDVCTILYFYLHERMRIPIDYASVIIAAYSGLIIYYLGKTAGERLNADRELTVDSESTANRLQKLENRQRIDSESTVEMLQKLEDRQRIDSESTVEMLQKLENRQRIDSESTVEMLQKLENRQRIDSESTANRLHELENRQRIDSECRELETEIARCRRRIRQSRSDETRRQHEQALAELEEKYDGLTNRNDNYDN